jgi:hypothetical protein
VSQLLVGMERRKQENKKRFEQMNSEGKELINDVYDKNYSTPHIILMTDQFGVCHAPFASARTLLNEHGYSDVLVVVHHHPTVCYQTCRVSELLPVPDGISYLSHDKFFLMSSEL